MRSSLSSYDLSDFIRARSLSQGSNGTECCMPCGFMAVPSTSFSGLSCRVLGQH